MSFFGLIAQWGRAMADDPTSSATLIAAVLIVAFVVSRRTLRARMLTEQGLPVLLESMPGAIPLPDGRFPTAVAFSPLSDTQLPNLGAAIRGSGAGPGAKVGLDESQARLDLALEAAQMGVWDLDLVHDTSVRSLQHDHIFGYRSIQPNWRAADFFQHVVPEDRELGSCGARGGPANRPP